MCQQKDITKLQASEDTESSSAHWNKSLPTVRALPSQNPCPSGQTDLLAARSCSSARVQAPVPKAGYTPELSSTPPAKVLLDISPAWPRPPIISVFF